MANGTISIIPWQSDVIKEVIRNKELSQRQVSVFLGYREATFCQYISGTIPMPTNLARKLYTFLDSDPRLDFLYRSGGKTD